MSCRPGPRWAVQKKIVLVSGDGGGGGARVYWPQTEFLACPAAHRAYFRDLRQAGERRSCRGRMRTIPLRWGRLGCMMDQQAPCGSKQDRFVPTILVFFLKIAFDCQ